MSLSTLQPTEPANGGWYLTPNGHVTLPAGHEIGMRNLSIARFPKA